MSDFEWLVVDDGSTDDTRALIERWAGEAPFPVRYFYQPNSGKHVAENVAAREARGQFVATIDSDDWYVPDALETFLSTWETIADSERDSFVGVVGLCADAQGTLLGTRFPADVFDTTYTDLALRHNVTGDKAGCGRTEIVRGFRFPVVPGRNTDSRVPRVQPNRTALPDPLRQQGDQGGRVSGERSLRDEVERLHAKSTHLEALLPRAAQHQTSADSRVAPRIREPHAIFPARRSRSAGTPRKPIQGALGRDACRSRSARTHATAIG